MIKKILIIAIVGMFFIAIFTVQNSKASAQCNLFNRRGCCSHHGGVCGCSSGRARCCDGSLSPSCGCD